jgi:stage V sporulation protein D (sporulation-specific penicillin-binding protein)
VPLFAVAGTLLVALVMIRLLVGYVSLTRLSHEAAELERRIAELMEEQAKLEIRYERAFDLEQVERYAMAELGMVRAGSEQKVYLNNALDDKPWSLPKRNRPGRQISEKIRAYFGSLAAYLKKDSIRYDSKAQAGAAFCGSVRARYEMAVIDVLEKTQKPNRVIVSRTLILLIVCGVLAFIVLIGRLYKVMIVDHDRYESAAVEQQVRETTVNASRGTIYDTNMKILAQSATVETVYISPVEMLKYGEDASMIASRLSEILAEQGVTYDGIMKKWADTGSWYKTVAVKLEREVADRVRAFKNEHDLKSVHIIEDTKRYYPHGSLASQIIGFTGTDNYGLEGLEAIYNKYLQGVNGRIVRATTSEGTDMLFTGFEDYYDAKDGDSLVLTIDCTVQYYLEKHLAQAIEDYDVKNGAIGIAMNVKTGAIIGMCSLPDYDPNDFDELNASALAKLNELNLTGEDYDRAYAEALREQWRSRATMDTYEPGSTFKIITLASALEEGVIDENDTFYCGGSIDVPGREEPLHCWKRTGHGSQTLAEAAQHSCNVAFVSIG